MSKAVKPYIEPFAEIDFAKAHNKSINGGGGVGCLFYLSIFTLHKPTRMITLRLNPRVVK